MDERQFTKIQPKHGERILHCGHLGAPKMHFFKVADGTLRFIRPDGTMGQSQWMVACDGCWQLAHGNPKALVIRGDGTWKGNDPAVYQTEDTGTLYENKPPDPNNN